MTLENDKNLTKPDGGFQNNTSRNNVAFYKAEKADVFSLGILLFTMYFGVPPFKWNTPTDPLFQCLSSGNPELLEFFFESHILTLNANKQKLIPLSLKNLLGKMLHIDPQQRPSIAELLLTDPWLNDPSNLMTYGEYHQTMDFIYKVNHGLQPELLLREELESEEEKLKS